MSLNQELRRAAVPCLARFGSIGDVFRNDSSCTLMKRFTKDMLTTYGAFVCGSMRPPAFATSRMSCCSSLRAARGHAEG
eukprot:7388774-Prymnesium_polylepis.1